MPLSTFLDTNWSALSAAWLLTYLLHSSLLLAGAWLLSERLGDRWLAVKETVWKLALVGGLATASLQVGLGLDPLAGAWSLQRADGNPTAPPEAPTAYATTGADRPAQRSARGEATLARAETTEAAAASGPLPAHRPPARAGAGDRIGAGAAAPDRLPIAGLAAARGWWLAAWLAGAAAGLLLLGLSHLRYRRRLRSRRDLHEGRLPRLLRDFLTRSRLGRRVRLTATPRIQVPLATGLMRPEICLPERALTALEPARQEVVVAHELAHLERRDPAWLLVCRLVERALFFQPLNRLARRRLAEISEYRCDDRAVELTGRPLSLARCLTQVAEWRLRPGGELPVPAMAVGRSGLARRIARVLDRRYPAPPESAPRWLAVALAAVLALTVLAAPGVSRGAPEAPEAPVAPAAPQSPETPPAPVGPDSPPVPAVAQAPSASRDREPARAPEAPAAPRPVIAEAPLAAPALWARGAAAPVAAGPMEAPAPIEEPPLGAELDALRELAAGLELAGGIDSDVERRLEEMAERLAAAYLPDPASLARIEALAEELARELTPDAATLERIGQLSEELALRSMPDPEAMARLQAMAERLARTDPADAEARRRLGEEARRLADEARPDREELARMRDELRALTERHRVDREKLGLQREELRRLHQELRPGREELERLRPELDRLRAELRAEVEKLRAERRRRFKERREAPASPAQPAPGPAPTPGPEPR